MHNLIYILAVGLLSIGCRKNQNNDSIPTDITWSKIIIKDEFFVGSFYGNIDTKMIIGTNQNILKTTDGGKTWIRVAQNTNGIREFKVIGDTLFAISSGWPNYFSLDDGDSWQTIQKEMPVNIVMQVMTSNNDIYKFIRNRDGENELPGDVLISSNNGLSWKNIFPYKHYVASIYKDSTDKVYLGVFGLTWKEWSFFQDNNNAIIYYTKGK